MPDQARLTLAFEGWAFRLGDFVVRVGKAQLRPREEFRGIVAEVEYAPLSNLDVAAAALTVRAFGGRLFWLLAMPPCMRAHCTPRTFLPDLLPSCMDPSSAPARALCMTRRPAEQWLD